MPPAPTTLRLAQIDPDALAADITATMARYLGRLTIPLSPGLTVHVDGPHGDAGVAMTAADLARYARGEGALDDAVESCALELVPLLASPLAPTQGDLPPVLTRWLSGSVEVGGLDHDSVEDRLALVIVAALGRERIDAGQPVTVAQLAVLGGMDPDSLRALGRRGEITVAAGEVAPGEARRWLASRAR